MKLIEFSGDSGDVQLVNPMMVARVFQHNGKTRINTADGTYVYVVDHIDEVWARLTEEESC